MKLTTTDITKAPTCLSANDKAWVLGYNEAVELANKQIGLLEDTFRDALEQFYAPEPNCSCHISPPCNDCVDYGAVREVLATVNRLLES